MSEYCPGLIVSFVVKKFEMWVCEMHMFVDGASPAVDPEEKKYNHCCCTPIELHKHNRTLEQEMENEHEPSKIINHLPLIPQKEANFSVALNIIPISQTLDSAHMTYTRFHLTIKYYTIAKNRKTPPEDTSDNL